ncbi:hypothetical protein H6F67_16620 [Microcoleus sp. FACHB-1515]|uniref:hypothetical protein n=1 Tax=Cyanophyceae TaxID=3028117 RepID=UPI001682B0F6|nr:hypothetical protein [Microcoleus sp. FACHB-1515]MBD2091469.1 hypothetical protein [Microcoleus sp. FACHB-1515]
MLIQKVPIATLQKIRAHLQPALKLEMPPIADEPPDSIAGLSDLFARSFDPVPAQGWQLSAIDPGAVLSKLPGLQLQPHYRLVGYLWRDDRGSRGKVWAVPIDRATTIELERAIVRSDAAAPPCPPAALPDWMQAIEGDRSPGSFLIASLLRRELQEWGASGTYQDWSYHRLIDRVPIALQQAVGADRLQDLSPRLRRMPDRRVAVEFFTCRMLSPVQIFRHVDLFSAADYTVSSLDREVLL